MDNTKLIQDAMDKIITERAEQVDAFVTAILKVRQDIGEEIDMNYIALEYGTRKNKNYNILSTIQVVYVKEKACQKC